MPSEIHVHFLPDHFEPSDVKGDTVIIVDILRASTTILAALYHGAKCILPCLSVDHAREHQRRQPDILLGGERLGQRIDGFDMSNSPHEYTAAAVRDRTIAFTTTNGTRALLMSRQAEDILIGAFANLSCLTERLANDKQPLHIVCAGTDGQVTGEDVLFAGCLVERLATRSTDDPQLSDAALIAMGSWMSATTEADVEEAMRKCLGGRNLVALGYDADIECAAKIDSAPVIGQFHPQSGAIVRVS